MEGDGRNLGAGVQKLLSQLRMVTAAMLVCAAVGSWSRANEPLANSEALNPLVLGPANWPRSRTAVEFVPAAPVAAIAQGTTQPGVSPGPNLPPIVVPPVQTAPQTQVVVPPTEVVPGPAPVMPLATPLLDDGSQADELLPSVIDENEAFAPERVRPYGGGHPYDWSWGCGGSPYRTHGTCDDWKVGCRWHVTVDGIVMTRENTDLFALTAQMQANDLEGTQAGDPLETLTPTFEQFDRGAGGRITFTSQVAPHVGWDMMCVYEGIPEWHSSIVFPKLPLDPPPLPPPGSPVAPDPLDLATEQRSLHYTSTLHSGELNFVRGCNSIWRPYCGVRYIKFDDEINDFYNQEAPPPLPEQLGPTPTPPALPPTLPFVTATDRLNLFDIQNDLIGFQVGLLHDTWRVNRRLAIEGFVNGGVYYNRIKYTNLMGTFTTQDVADNLDTPEIDESRVDFSDTVNNDVREYSEISYVTEASLSGVCRLNKCWALRAGYQMLWITNVHLADAAYRGDENSNDDLFFHGWHAGVECRR